MNIPPRADLKRNKVEAEMHKYDIFWFVGKVRPGGDWDYKRDLMNVWTKYTVLSPFEDFGNFNYGYTGRALGLPAWLLQRGAGAAQMLTLGSVPQWDNALGDYPYGDQPSDQEMIDRGINCYDLGIDCP
jgi:hypothetical protein